MRLSGAIKSLSVLCLLVAGCADSHEMVDAVDASFYDGSPRPLDGSPQRDAAVDAPTTCDPSDRPMCGEQCGTPVEATCWGDVTTGFYWQCDGLLYPCEVFCDTTTMPTCANDCTGASQPPLCDHSTGEWSCFITTDECPPPPIMMCPTNTLAYEGTACADEGAVCGASSCCEDNMIWCSGGTWVGVSRDLDDCEGVDCLPPYTCGSGTCAFGELCVLDEDVFQCLHVQSGPPPLTCEEWIDLVSSHDEHLSITCESTEPFGFMYARYVL